MVESQGKVSEKSGNFEMDIEWQPCYFIFDQYTCIITIFLFASKILIIKNVSTC